MDPQPHLYRITLLRDGDPVDRMPPTVAVLDFRDGDRLRATAIQLDQLLQDLIFASGGDRNIRRYALAIHDPATGDYKAHWPAKTWDHPR